MSKRPTTFLLVDDDIVCMLKFKKFLNKAGAKNRVVTATDGLSALDVLRGRNGKAKLDRPFLVILDLSMPRMDGFELLAEIRNDPALCDVPVYVMTTSDNADSIDRAMLLGADGYVPKHDSEIGFEHVIDVGTNLDGTVQTPPIKVPTVL